MNSVITIFLLEWMTPRMRKDMGALMAAMRDLERSIKNDCLYV